MIGTSVRNQATSVRYEPDENPPGPLTFGCGAQLVVVGITGLVLIPTIVIRAAGGSETYLSWTVFCTVAISGACTALQAVRCGRLGAGYVLWAGPGAAVIGISVTALVVKLDATGLSRLREFIGEFASRGGWDEKMARRLEAASGESLLALLDRDGGRANRERRRLFLSARKDIGGAILEFVGARGEENIQDWIGLLAERPDDVLVQQKVSLRLLRHIASSVLHQQFNDTDIVTVRVDARGPPPPAFGAPWA